MLLYTYYYGNILNAVQPITCMATCTVIKVTFHACVSQLVHPILLGLYYIIYSTIGRGNPRPVDCIINIETINQYIARYIANNVLETTRMT